MFILDLHLQSKYFSYFPLKLFEPLLFLSFIFLTFTFFVHAMTPDCSVFFLHNFPKDKAGFFNEYSYS